MTFLYCRSCNRHTMCIGKNNIVPTYLGAYFFTVKIVQNGFFNQQGLIAIQG